MCHGIFPVETLNLLGGRHHLNSTSATHRLDQFFPPIWLLESRSRKVTKGESDWETQDNDFIKCPFFVLGLSIGLLFGVLPLKGRYHVIWKEGNSVL